MFPYVCLATMPIFCDVSWPRKFTHWFKEIFSITKFISEVKDEKEKNQKNEHKFLNRKEVDGKDLKNFKAKNDEINNSKKQKFVTSILLLHIAMQLFLPYSHFLTKVN